MHIDPESFTFSFNYSFIGKHCSVSPSHVSILSLPPAKLRMEQLGKGVVARERRDLRLWSRDRSRATFLDTNWCYWNMVGRGRYPIMVCDFRGEMTGRGFIVAVGPRLDLSNPSITGPGPMDSHFNDSCVTTCGRMFAEDNLTGRFGRWCY